MLKLRKYSKVYITGIRSSLIYKTNFFFSLLNVIFCILIQCIFWSALFNNSNSKNIGGYNYSQIILYSIISRLLSELIATGFEYKINYDIKSGNLSTFIIKPIDYLLYQKCFFYGEKTAQILISFCSLIIIKLLFYPCMFNIALIIPIFLALILNSVLFSLVSMLGFLFEEVSYVILIIKMIFDIFSGLIFPISMFPKCISIVLKFLPFQYTVYSVTNLLINKFTFLELFKIIFLQISWIIFIGIICKYLWKLGVKRYVSVGG